MGGHVHHREILLGFSCAVSPWEQTGVHLPPAKFQTSLVRVLLPYCRLLGFSPVRRFVQELNAMFIKCRAWHKAHGFITAAPAAAQDVSVAMGCFDVVLVVACFLRWPGSTIATGAYRHEGGFSETQSACLSAQSLCKRNKAVWEAGGVAGREAAYR